MSTPNRRRRLVQGAPTRRTARVEPKFEDKPDCRPVVELAVVCPCFACGLLRQERAALPGCEEA